jgi:hypothetical protein
LIKDARPELDKVLTEERTPPPPEHFRDTVFVQNGALWSIGKWLFLEDGQQPMSDDDVTLLYNVCPPFQAFVLAIFINFYDNAVESLKTKNTGKSDSKRAKASRNDLFQALYLPYCDRFVSADAGCLSALTWVSNGMRSVAKVQSYADFTEPFLKPLS